METMATRLARAVRFFAAAAAVLVLPAGVATGATFVGNIGTASNTRFGNSSISVTVGASGVAAGDSIIVGFAHGTFAGPVGCSDTKGNSYSVDADRNNGGAGRVTICSAHGVAALAAGDQITATYPAFSGYTTISANEFSGLQAAGAFDKSSTATGNNHSPSSGFTAVTSQPDELLYGAIFFSGTNFATFSPGAGYTRTNPDLSGRPLASEYMFVSATGSYQANGATSKANQWAAAIATYKAGTVVPVGSCSPSSSLSVLVAGTNVTSYVPKASWIGATTGVSVVNVEGSAVVPTLIPTTSPVNSCASNSLTSMTVCTANDTDVYLLSGTALGSTLSSGGSGLIGFSGGSCTNCGVAMDAVHNKAVIGLSLAGVPGFQFLNLAGPAFEPAFASMSGLISENPLIDPTRNLLLSAAENNTYEIIDVTTSTSPSFFENIGIPSAGELDSSGEDCSTGIALAPAEFSSDLYIADLTQAIFTPGAPGTWSAASQVQTLTESPLAAGFSGIAVAQGTFTGVITGEFGGSTFTAIALPTTSGSGTPAVSDWVTCGIPGFSMGFDPHGVTAYKSPNSGDAIALLANDSASAVEMVDLTKMLDPLIVPRTVGGHACASGALPASVVTEIPVP